MFRKITETFNFKPVTEEQFEQLTVPLKKMGVTIMRGDDKVEEHLKKEGAYGSAVGTDVIFFRRKVSISTILEETHHIKQNRAGLNDNLESDLRTILNEIDAKKYLLSVAKEYKIPRDEIEETKQHLKFYENELKKWRG
ncbi:MAG: hypothetical protein J6I62_07285 [Selenomonadaceae bacterium]|nr:hypothetical protein [Selenomonadaceae bacterium]